MGFKAQFRDHITQGYGDTIALIDAHQKFSYRQLLDAIDERVSWLAKWRVPSGVVALSFTPNIWSVVTYLACLEAKIPLLLLDPNTSTKLILPQLTTLGVVCWIKSATEQEIISTQGAECHPDVALLLSTSGSTGAAKSVMLSMQNLLSNAQSISQYLPMSYGDCGISSLPLSYSYGLSLLNSHLLVGATFVLTSEPLISKVFWNLMLEHNVSSLAGVPFSYQMLKTLRFERMALPALKTLTQAGGKLSQDLARHFYQVAKDSGRKLYLMYGQTEATARMGYLPPEYLPEYADCIGISIPGGTFCLRDLQTRALIETDYTQGELCYQGDNVMLGYASDAAALKDVSQISELTTGDIAERLPNGLYRIKGRLSRFIKVQGKRFALDEIEASLTQAEFGDCIACGQDERLVIAHLPTMNCEALRTHCLNVFGLHPSLFTLLECSSYPRLNNGKLDYALLLATVNAGVNRLDLNEQASDVQSQHQAEVE
jgi:acyl-CoA synthetase (AMP-forming)/AMP-acid ligase II